MIQLSLLPEPTHEPRTGFWPDLGRAMMGEGPEPHELCRRARLQRNIEAVASAHRRRVNDAAGRRE